jgi:hypothetical protein
MSAASTPEPDREDESPRPSLWAALPRRNLARVLLLLVLLAAILYLRARTGAITACMSEAFQAPAPPAPGVRVRLPAWAPPDGGGRHVP